MELRRLKDFVALAEELHYERAAQRVGTDQSGLSRRIKELERDLGNVELFRRTTRGTKIAAAGIAFLPIARNILGSLDLAERVVREAATGEITQVRIGVCDEAWVKHLARLVTDHQTKEPSVDLQLRACTCKEIVQNVRTGVLDLGLCLGPASDSDLHSVEVWNHHLCAVLPPNHRLANDAGLTITDLAKERLLVGHRECSCGGREALDQFIHSVNPGARVEGIANLNAMRALVSTGRGVGLVSSAQAESVFDADVTIRPLMDRSFQFHTFILYRPDNDSQLMARFVDLARPPS